LSNTLGELQAHPKILFIAGFAHPAIVRNGQIRPGIELLMKPFRISSLEARVRELLAS
jgi:hypothetical protein